MLWAPRTSAPRAPRSKSPPNNGWCQPLASDPASLERLCATLELWRPHRSQAQRVSRLQHQLLIGLNCQAQRRLQVGDHVTSTRLLRVAEGLIAAAASESQSPQPSDELKVATFELCARSHYAASRRIPSEGAGRAAAARLRQAVQYDARVLALSRQDADRLARAHARLAIAFSGMHGQNERSVQHLNSLVLLSSTGSVQHETISTIIADLRAKASETTSKLVAAADVLSFAAQAAAAGHQRHRVRAGSRVESDATATATTGVCANTECASPGERVSSHLHAVGKAQSPNSQPAPKNTAIAGVAGVTTTACVAPANKLCERNRDCGWDSRPVIHTRIGHTPPPLPKPMYTSAAERRAAKIGWRVGDSVLALHQSGKWIEATIDAKRHQPGGGWYVLSQEGSFQTAEIRLRESKLKRNCRSISTSTERYTQQIEDGRQFLGFVEEIVALNAAFQPERALLVSEQQAAYVDAVARLDDEDMTARHNAANASRRLRLEATAAAQDLISRLLTLTVDGVAERRRLEQEKFEELDIDQSGQLTKQQMKQELLRRGIGCAQSSGRASWLNQECTFLLQFCSFVPITLINLRLFQNARRYVYRHRGIQSAVTCRKRWQN